MFKISILIIQFWFIALFLTGQMLDIPTQKSKKGKEENITLESDTLSKIDTDVIKTEEFMMRYDDKQTRKKKKDAKKRKGKKMYLGIKTRGGFIRDDDGESYDLFRTIPFEQVEKTGNLKNIHYYDRSAGKIKSDDYANIEKKIKKGLKIYILHGHYQQIKEGEVRMEGYYNKGHRHEKWYEFDKNGILIEKLDYHQGYSEETMITHHDNDSTKLKEILPMVHGRIQGKYVLYHKNGVVAKEGKFDNNEKIGFWREWYDNKKMKKEEQYPQHWYDKTEPILLREWDEKGKLIYDKDKGGKQK
ncbi:MAG: hypothetical protein EAZ85_04970 [Bacteroidetes bacterium]|nr:MAG: hypothetical protein EAZ85_04970 [Bacteroidota bacterium]TAG91389.1 MAG: hypothetical protein EAZ20_03330 [Bacteroidota bacterium]